MIEDKPGFFDKPQRVKAVIVLLFVSCAFFLALDWFVVKEHAHFAWEAGFGFYPAYGFVAYVVLVLISKYILRPLVMRKEDYYD